MKSLKKMLYVIKMCLKQESKKRKKTDQQRAALWAARMKCVHRKNLCLLLVLLLLILFLLSFSLYTPFLCTSALGVVIWMVWLRCVSLSKKKAIIYQTSVLSSLICQNIEGKPKRSTNKENNGANRLYVIFFLLRSFSRIKLFCGCCCCCFCCC